MLDIGCGALRQRPAGCATGPPDWKLLAKLLKGPEDAALIPRWSFYTNSAASPDTPANRVACTRYDGTHWLARAGYSAWVLLGDLWGGLPTILHAIFGQTSVESLIDRHAADLEGRQNAGFGVPKQPCLPFPRITASVLLNPTGQYDTALDALLANRLVLIGDGRAASPDSRPTPLHGTLPGVNLQATALETLLSYGNRYIPSSDSDEELHSFIEWMTRIAIVALGFSLHVIAHRGTWRRVRRHTAQAPSRAENAPSSWHSRIRGRFRFKLYDLVFLLLVVLLVVVLETTTSYAPANWILLIVTALATILGLGEIPAPSHRHAEEHPRRKPTTAPAAAPTGETHAAP
jgi:hypothetical protein